MTSIFTIRYRYFFITILSIYSYLNIYFTVGQKVFDFYLPQPYLLAILSSVIIGTWELNRLAEKWIDRIQQFLGHKFHVLIVTFAISLLNVLLVCIVCIQILYLVMGMPQQLNATHLTLLLTFGFRVNLFLNCVNAIVFFMNRLKKTQIEAEHLKKITIEAQFEALRNQINPHFLFNCFNVLSTLVYKDADTSSKFIAQLSNVYRYLLYTQEKKLVALSDEIAFIDSYLYLLKIRFGENVVIQKNISHAPEKSFVAPAVLQMLIENAIKHNIISKKKPLRISITTTDDSICISNSLQEKESKEESSNLGLRNIKNRYAFLTDQSIVVTKTDDEFSVSIPLLFIEES